MKNLLFITTLLLVGQNGFAQFSCQPPAYFFNNKTNVSGSGGVGSVYRFTSVLNGIDAVITITKTQNATTTNAMMDQTGNYPLAWQPFITFPNSRSNANDSSYLEFKIEFQSNVAPNPTIDQACMSMTIVDLDGPNNANSYREMIKVSLPATPYGVLNSTVTVFQDAKWILYKGASAQFNNIDTHQLAAMAQSNFPPTTKSFFMRVGVVGPVSANQQREFSFYFKSFAGLTSPLPLTLLNFKAVGIENNALVNWASVNEKNFSRFELYRSGNGIDFTYAGSVQAKGANSQFTSYTFTDAEAGNTPGRKVFYKLNMIDLDETNIWSQMIYLDMDNSGPVSSLGSVFPNPVSQTLNVDLGYVPESDINVQIFDIYGKMVKEQGYSNCNTNLLSLDMNDLVNGVYMVNILNHDGSVFTERLIKH